MLSGMKDLTSTLRSRRCLCPRLVCWRQHRGYKVLTTTSGPDDVLIKLNATGLCLSDVHFMMNDWGMPKMSELGTQCAGHEGAGVIVKVGERVKHLKVGMRAGHKPIQDVCHVCDACKSGNDSYCMKCVFTGLHCDGKFEE